MSGICAVGITWLISEPMWMLWDNTAVESGIDAVTRAEQQGREAAATLLRERSLPVG